MRKQLSNVPRGYQYVCIGALAFWMVYNWWLITKAVFFLFLPTMGAVFVVNNVMEYLGSTCSPHSGAPPTRTPAWQDLALRQDSFALSSNVDPQPCHHGNEPAPFVPGEVVFLLGENSGFRDADATNHHVNKLNFTIIKVASQSKEVLKRWDVKVVVPDDKPHDIIGWGKAAMQVWVDDWQMANVPYTRDHRGWRRHEESVIIQDAGTLTVRWWFTDEMWRRCLGCQVVDTVAIQLEGEQYHVSLPKYKFDEDWEQVDLQHWIHT